MKAIQIHGEAGRFSLILAEVPRPSPSKGQVLVSVQAAGVTPSELDWYPTTHTKNGETRQLPIPGHEFSGVIAELGAEVEGFSVGDAVYGMNDWFADGATAEYCVTDPANIALKPKSLTHEEAATVPIGALTAWQGLVDRAELRQGERVLIHGGAGAVGLFAIQIAHNAGAFITTTVSARNIEVVKRLGADQTIDYKTERFEDIAKEMDVVFDTVGGETLARSWQTLKPSGRMVTIASNAEASTEPRAKEAFFIVEPKQSQLIEVAKQLDAGTLKAFVGAMIDLEDAPRAYEGKVGNAKGYGKVVIRIASDTQR